ncbi:MAG: uracil-DNA glycosylase [Gammaproteobacteria bacterium]|nr:uracil-DNA glycosylase [Gammaproteobacteria bacterium]
MTDRLRRSQYLAAMGIQEWVSRAAVPGRATPLSDGDPRPADGAPGGPSAGDVMALDWEALQQRVTGCTACDLHRTRTQTVFGVGNRRASWMFIGEAPGADEDRQGEPFVGRAGQLLNLMLQAIGLKREEVYIANTLKCRPPNNRDPRPEEVACCEPFLERQVRLIQPKIMLALGRIAAHNLLKTDTPLARLRGRVHHYGETGIPLVVTYHPAYLLRTPLDKRKAWEDLLFAREIAQGGG